MMHNKKQIPKALKALIVVFAVIAIFAAVYAVQTFNNRATVELDIDSAQALVDKSLSSIIEPTASGTVYVYDNTRVVVTDVKRGGGKEYVVTCDYSTYDVARVVEENLDEYLTSAYTLYINNEKVGKKTNGTKIKLEVSKRFEEDMLGAVPVSGSVDFHFYETHDGILDPYFSDELINSVFGGIVDAAKMVSKANTVKYEGAEYSITNQNTLRTGIKYCFALKNYTSSKPDTAIPMVKLWNSLKFDFERNFIANNQYKYITGGLVTTLQITFLAVLLGIVIGFVVAVIRVTNQKTGKLSAAASVCKLYLSIMRGTPVMVQLLIIYFVILLPIGVEKFPAAVLCFGLNSGAYVSEIVRGGIMSIDAGQMEAGRSLGFNYIQTMYYIVIPQAFKAVLPSLANEFITLLKESSVAFYIGVADLTQGGLKIRSITYSNFMPLIAVAVIYLILVLGLTKCVNILERRLQKGDKG